MPNFVITNKNKDYIIGNIVNNYAEGPSASFITYQINNGKNNNIGKIVQVKIKDSNRNTLFGEIIANSDKKVA